MVYTDVWLYHLPAAPLLVFAGNSTCRDNQSKCAHAPDNMNSLILESVIWTFQTQFTLQAQRNKCRVLRGMRSEIMGCVPGIAREQWPKDRT